MKRLVRLALLLALLLFSAALVACGEAPEKQGSAKEYTITFSVDGKTSTVKVEEGKLPVFPGSTDKAPENGYSYTFTGWTPDVAPASADATYTAVYSEKELASFSVRWIVGSERYTTTAYEGEIPTPPDFVREYDDAIGVHTFSGWNKDPVPATVDGAVYVAKFDLTRHQYEITFSVDGKETKATVEGGKTPVYSGSLEKAGDEIFSYTFLGWEPELKEATENMTYTAQYRRDSVFSASVCAAKGDAKAVLSMTFDDGIYDTLCFLHEEFAKNDLHGSSMMIVRNNLGSVYNESSINYNNYKQVFADGYLEPQSHSMTHAPLPTDAWAGSKEENAQYLSNNTQKTYQYELIDSLALLKQYFCEYDLITFAPSNNTLSTFSYKTNDAGRILTDASGEWIREDDGGAQKIACETFFAVRQGMRGMQSLDPGFGFTPGSWHNLWMRGFGDAKNDLDVAKKWVDDAIENRGWLVTMCHGITPTGGDMKQDVASQYFAYIGTKVASGELWSATFSEATKYIRERQGANISADYEDGKVTVSLTLTRETEDGLTLDPQIFDMPLTVKLRVLDDWTSVTLGEGEGATELTSYTEGGERFVLFDMAPPSGIDPVVVTLTKK